MKSLTLALLGSALILLSTTSSRAQTTTIWNDQGGDALWTDDANWSATSPTTIVGNGGTAIVQIGTDPSLGAIRIDTGATTPIVSLTFNNTLTTGTQILPTAGVTLLVNGAIDNASASDQTITASVSAGANATYTGGTAGLTLDQLTLNTKTIATSGTIDLSHVVTTINSTSAFGSIGSNGSTLNFTNGLISITTGSNFTPAAGNSFDLLKGTITGTVSLDTLPTLPSGLVWNTSTFATNGTISIAAPADQSLSNPTPSTINIITGATTTVSATLTNTVTGSNPLAVNLADNGSTGGTISNLSPTTASNTTVASGSPITVSGTLTAGGVGTGTWSISNTDPNAVTTTVSTGGTVNVYNHSAAALTTTSGNNQSAIVGSSLAAPTFTLSNTTGTSTVPLDVSTLSNLTGTTGSGVVASGSTGTYTSTGLNTATPGVGQTQVVSLKAGDQQTVIGANPLSTLTQTVTYNVYNHSTPSLSVTGGNNQSVIANTTIAPVTVTLADTTGTTPAPLDVNSLSNLTGGATGSNAVASGGTVNYTATGLDNTTVGVGKTVTVSLNAGDSQSIAGANALSAQTATVTYNVYNHSAPTLTVASGNNQSVIAGNALSAATVTLADTTGTTPAPLDVNTLSNLTGTTGSGVVASGGTGTYTATGFNTGAGIGQTLNVSLNAGDQQTISGANPLTAQNATITYNIYNHSAPTLTVASGSSQSAIVGSALAATFTLSDTAGTAPAPLDVNTLSGLTGSTGSGVVSSGGTGTYTATGINTSTVGLGQTFNVSLNAGDQQTIVGASALSTLNQSITYNVYNHSTPTLTIAGGNNQSVIAGTALSAATVTLADTTGTTPAPLDVNTLSNLTGTTGSGVVASGGTGTYTATGFNTGVGVGQTLNVSLLAGDQQTISGANPLTTQSATFTYSIYNHSAPSLTVTSGNNQNVIVGGTLTDATLTLADTAGTTPAPLDVNTLSNLTGTTGSGVVASGGTGTYTTTALSSATVGAGQTLSVSLKAGDQQTIAGANALTQQTATVTYNVYNHATSSLTTGTLNLGQIHADPNSLVTTAAVNSSNSLSVTNGASGDFRVNLEGSAAANGNISLSSISGAGIAAGSSGSISATLAAGQGLGAINTPITYTFADDSNLSGASANVGTASITVTGQVYSGQGVWNTNGSGNWSDFSKWTTNGGAPGLNSNYVDTDTATFDNTTLTPGSQATVSLNDTSPSLKAITFNTQGGVAGYTIAPTTGGDKIKLNNGSNIATISDASGIQTISAPLELDSDTQITSADTLILSGGISGSKSLTTLGQGTVELLGAGTYTGETNIGQGTFQIGTAGSLLATSAVTLGSSTNSGTLVLGDTNGAISQTVASLTTFGTGSTNAVVGGSSAVSSLTVANTSSDVYGGVIGGSGSHQNNIGLIVDGAAALALTGANTYTGGTTITAGTLQIGSNTALGAGNVINTAGTLETYSTTSQHVINISGNYTQASSGTLSLNLSAAPDVNGLNAANDILKVTGTASLNGTLVLNFIPSMSFVPTAGEKFEIVETNLSNPANPNGITDLGTGFSTPPANVVFGAPDLKVTGTESQDNNDLFITLGSSQLNVAGLLGSYYTPNRAAVLSSYDTTAFLSNFQSFSGALAALAQNPNAQLVAETLANIADQGSPLKFSSFYSSNTYNNAIFTTQELTTYFHGQISSQGDFEASNGQFDSSGLTIMNSTMDPALAQTESQLLAWNPAPLGHGMLSDVADPLLAGVDSKNTSSVSHTETGDPFNLFAVGSVILGQDFSQAEVAHASTTTGTVQLGASYRVTPNLRLGGYFGFNHTDANIDESGSKASSDTYSPGIFASYANSGWYANALANYGFDSFTQDRVSTFPTRTTAHGTPYGGQVVANLDGGYDFHIKNLTVGPTAGLQYTNLYVDSFSETGSGVPLLAVNGQDSDSLRSLVGGHVSYLFHTGKVSLTPHFDASWQHEFLDGSENTTWHDVLDPTESFAVHSQNPSRDSALLDLGLNADLCGQFTVFGDYAVQAGQSNYFGQSVQAGLKIGF